ncbi:hypothetical protein DSL72_000821 [Monilinia vaccinii-corymbosi]|uniref:Rhodopsin domain-containing protein n=1 Tax=Monilinia vaccinii-corymbosi TaxID=61207 RepID=A0A8A3P8T7_9HELO|nr:hypothetical protein DSL72_000821 [Monilinia vaccinii-corymbosi]
MFLKLSISVFLLRLSSVPLHRYIILATLAVSEVGGTFYFLVFIFQCQPSRYFWTKFTGESGTCVDANFTVVAGYAYSAISCATDWILSLIPIWVICTLQMTPRDKISVAIILSMGAMYVLLVPFFVSCFPHTPFKPLFPPLRASWVSISLHEYNDSASTATIIRMPYLRDLSNVDDFLFATVDVAIWSTTETCIGIIASSAATLRPLFRNFFTRTKLFGNSTTGQSRLSTNWSRHPDSEGGGYIRQNNLNSDVGALSSARSGEDSDDCKLRDDIPLHSGVITTIATGKKKAREHYDDVSNEPLPHATDGGGQGIELESAPLQDPRPAALKGKPLGKRISRHGGKWGGVRGKSRDWSDSRSLSIEDSILGMGITKTTNTEIRSVRMSRVGGGQKSRE